MSSVYLLSEAKTEHCRELVRLVNKAIAAAPNMTHEAYLAFLSDKERIKEALENSGIDARQEANFLAKKLQHRYFCIDFLINNEFVLFLNDSQAPGPQIISDIPGIDGLAMQMNIATSRREKAPLLCEIRRILTDKGVLSMDALYLPADLWEISSTCAILSIFTTDTKQKETDKFAAFIADSYGMQASITAKKYQYALTTKVNETAYIAVTDGSIFDDPNGGTLNENLLQQILTAVGRSKIIQEGPNITVKLSIFCREMGIDPHDKTEKHKGGHFRETLKAIENLYGIMGQDRYAVLKVIQYEPTKDIMVFTTPYMLELFNAIGADKEIRRISRSGKEYQRPALAHTTKSTITSERNGAAREIVNRITAALSQRGCKTDMEILKQGKKAGRQEDSGIITYRTTFRHLIASCPTLQTQLLRQKDANAKNTYLRRAFLKAYELLRTQTVLYEYWLDLSIDEKIYPTSKTLDSDFIITHRGKNPNYRGKTPFSQYSTM